MELHVNKDKLYPREYCDDKIMNLILITLNYCDKNYFLKEKQYFSVSLKVFQTILLLN